MQAISRFLLVAVLANVPGSAFAQAEAPKESVTMQVNADLLKRARAQNMDLALALEKQLRAMLGGIGSATPTAHRPFLTAAFDNIDATMFAPLKVTAQTPAVEVAGVCKATTKDVQQLLADAETRKTMPLPTSLGEAKTLDEFIQRRVRAFQERMAKVNK